LIRIKMSFFILIKRDKFAFWSREILMIGPFGSAILDNIDTFNQFCDIIALIKTGILEV